MEVPLEFKSIFVGDEVIERDEPADPLKKFLETAVLDAASGRRGHTETSIADIDRRAAELYRGIAARAATSPAPASLKKSEWDAPLIDRTTLAKRATPDGARVETSANGKWEMTYDAAGELISGRQISE
jgi:hypothetical protein